MKRIFIVIAILVLTVAAAIALGMDRNQTVLAQGPQPPDREQRGGSEDSTDLQWDENRPAGAGLDSEIQASPKRRMSYQGKLEIDGSPCNGVIDITFRLFDAATGGTEYWEESQSVTCDNGIFSVMLGSVNAIPMAVNFQEQLWLSVQPEGAAAELLPRQLLSTVGYAMNLMPSATMVDQNPASDPYWFSFWVHSYEHNGIYASSDLTDGVGLEAHADGDWGGGLSDPIGVYGDAWNGIGVKGTSDEYKGVEGVAGYMGVSGRTTGEYGYGVRGTAELTGSVAVYGYSYGFDGPAIYGESYGGNDSCPVGDNYCKAAVLANGWSADEGLGPYGLFGYAIDRSGLIADTASTSYYAAAVYNTNGNTYDGLYVQGETYLAGYLTVGGGKSGYVVDIAYNAGSEPLERGDVVVVIGMDAPVVGEIPVMRVQKATPETASAIVGVVDVLFEPCNRPAEELQAGEACGGYTPEVTTIQPGQYLGVVTLGAFQWLKVDASTPIKAGDLLSISPTAGVAAKATQITLEGYSFYAPGTIIGKALQDMDAGTGYIAVFVSLK